jgi:BlaI family penicillinase repressor
MEVILLQSKRNVLTPTEWTLMECLWEKSPRSGREAVEYLTASAGWSRSTTLTMLRRMTEKNMICCLEQDGINVYTPLIPKEEATQSQTEDFLNRVFGGSVSMMLSAFTKKQSLSKEEIDALYAILKEAEEDA